MKETELDSILHDALSPANRRPDERFVFRLEMLALAERRLREARQAAFHRFGIELAASVSVAAAFLLTRFFADPNSGGAEHFSGSAAAGTMLILIWLATWTRADSLPFIGTNS